MDENTTPVVRILKAKTDKNKKQDEDETQQNSNGPMQPDQSHNDESVNLNFSNPRYYSTPRQPMVSLRQNVAGPRDLQPQQNAAIDFAGTSTGVAGPQNKRKQSYVFKCPSGSSSSSDSEEEMESQRRKQFKFTPMKTAQPIPVQSGIGLSNAAPIIIGSDSDSSGTEGIRQRAIQRALKPRKTIPRVNIQPASERDGYSSSEASDSDLPIPGKVPVLTSGQARRIAQKSIPKQNNAPRQMLARRHTDDEAGPSTKATGVPKDLLKGPNLKVSFKDKNGIIKRRYRPGKKSELSELETFINYAWF